jgi:hypothetical protein
VANKPTVQPDHSRLQLITCPTCKATFPLEAALRAEIEEGVLDRLAQQHEAQLAQARQETAKRLTTVLTEKFSTDLQNARSEAAEQRAANKELRESLLDLNRQLRKLSTERETERLTNETALRESQETIRAEEKLRAVEEHRLKELEADKKLKDALSTVDQLQRRLEQGSQQLQGEVLELDLEAHLRALFPGDDILPVKTGVRGADLTQVVRTPLGAASGTILWEAKNAQWQPSWIGKLKTDMGHAGADHGVLISPHTPDSCGAMGHLEGRVWGARPPAVGTLASVLRQTLLHTHAISALSADKGARIEALYGYITSAEFRHRIEALQDYFTSQHDEQEKEKRWMNQKWARQDKQLRAVTDHVFGLVGDFEGLNGAPILPVLPAGGDSESAADDYQ